MPTSGLAPTPDLERFGSRATASVSWKMDGLARPEVQGCLDVDLESSSLTNALPVHRLRLAVGESAEAPAVYVRAQDLSVERLEQHYRRVDDGAAGERYDYAAPRFGY